MKRENRSNQAVSYCITNSATENTAQHFSAHVNSAPHAHWPDGEVELPDTTGPLGELACRRPLVVLDVENISITAERLGFRVSYEHIARKLRVATNSRCLLHAVFSATGQDRHRADHFRACGWEPHEWEIEYVWAKDDWRRRANSDPAILFIAGHLIATCSADTVVIGTGDGDLGCDLARLLWQFEKAEILTLSLASSTSRRLKAGRNPIIRGNVEIGRDSLTPIN